MKTLPLWLSAPITSGPADSRLAHWSGIFGGVAQLGFAAMFFFRYAHTAAELATGVAVSLLVCGLSVECGLLTGRVDSACRIRPVRSRRVEFAGYALGLAILPTGFWYLSTLSLERAGMTIGLLSILGLTLGSICLGAWSTLRLCRVGTGL